ncbi:MAG: hypothetical protein ACRDVC_10000 [Acidimicrobiales bacterium]
MLSMLLDDNDLVSADLKTATEHTYRTFAKFDSTDAVDRARANGSITAVRVLRDDVAKRSLRISVIPFVSASDAASSVQRALDNVRFKLGNTATTQSYVEGVSVQEVSHVLIREIIGAGPRGPAGDRLLAGNVDNFLVSIAFQAQGSIDESWPWEEIATITARQARKIRKVLMP